MKSRLQILLILILGGSASPLFSSLNCLEDGVGASEDCYHTFDEVIADIGIFGESIKDLAYKSDSGNEKPFDLEHDTPAPTKKLTLKVLEKAVKERTGFVESPIGYLTNYGYVKGVLRAFTTCAGSEDVVHSDEIYASMVTFLSAQRTSESQAWETMNRTRCSDPDITFDEDGNLDEQSAEIVLNALEGSDAVKERVGEFKKSVEATKRKKRNANPSSRLDLSEKNEFTYKLVNEVDGMPFAQDSVDIAFESWSNAIGSALTFTSTAGRNPDVKLSFVPDEHDDWTFSGAELAHAPFPNTEWHGNVHYRENRDWDIESANNVDFTYVTVHELGHYLGLKHSSVDGSVMQAIMDSTTIPDSYSGKLSPSDELAVKLLYAGAGSSNCPDDWHAFDGVCYITETVTAGVTWDEAQANCEKLGGNLTTVRNGPLNHHILSTVANGRTPYWIGRKSSETGWVDGQSFDWFPELNNRKQMDPSTKSPKCLRTIAYSGSPKWEYTNCNSKRVKTEHYVCQKNEEDFEPEPTLPPTTEPQTSVPTELPTQLPCQNYIRGAIRRGNFLYIFGNNKYFKYYHTNSRPTLQLGYPKDITENFEGIPSSFTAVVTNPYDRDMIYFVDDQEVYEWQVTGKRSSIEDGKLKKRGKTGNKPKKLKSLFKTTNIIRGATVFDRNSIMLFARGEVGRWYRETIGQKMVSRYDTVDKWDYLDSMGTDVDAVAESHFDKFIMFIRDDRYFLVRKSDGKIPRKFIRNLSSDFDKLEICDVIAPFITQYPENIDPDQALLEEDQ